MDYTTRYPSRSNSDPSTTIYTGEADYQHNFKAHWLNSMYSTQHLDSANKQLLRGALDGNERNYNISRMYSTKQSLSADNINNQPKRESMWQSLTKSATNFLGEHLTRGTGSFFKNWSSMNSPLSVTVVSPDFYKSLQAGKDHQLVNPCEGLYSKNRTWSKDSQSSDNSLPNVLYNNEITSDTKSSSDSNDSDQRWNEYKNMYVFNGEQEKNLITDTKIVNSVNKNDFTNETMESHFNVIIDDEKAVDKSTNFGNTLRVDDEPVMIEKPEYSEAQQQLQEQQQQQTAQSQPQGTTVQPTAMGTLLTNAYNKVVSGVVDLLTQRSASPEPVSDSLFLKRACSPKLRPKKVHNISSGRGRGRAKSQLRRSGVSQKRHRKERSRYDRSDDIKSDIDNWEEIDYCTSDDEECDAEGVDVCDFGGKHFENHASGFILADVHPKKRKPKKGKNRGWTQVSVSISLQGLDADGDIKHPFRQRLLSESSVESDDSYCIIFEDDDDCSEDEDYETKRKSCLESETESETKSEDEVTHVEVHPTKVRFDPTPTIYPMIHWNYAYRAARRGPWEEMGRDRERFRGRIHCIGRILEPVLSKQHRMQVWHERFED